MPELPAPVRVLVVDDSALARRILVDVLRSDMAIDVVGTAPHGRLALDRIHQLAPDVVVLDVEMPEMDGLEVLRALRDERNPTRVIMCSTVTARGATATLDALSLGAVDYVTKPAGVSGLQAATAELRAQLVPKVLGIAAGAKRRRNSAPTSPAAAPSPPPSAAATAPRRAPGSTGRRIDAVVIAVSTGGPRALGEVIPRLPRELPVPVFVVQHMPASFTPLLAGRLAQASVVPVVEGADEQTVRPGTVYVAPGGRHMEVAGVAPLGMRIHLTDGEPENSCRPSAEPLLRSAVDAYSGRVLAVVMTGMGHDGAAGCARVVQSGGEVFAQDEATSVVWGMPGAVVEAGLAQRQVPLDELAGAIAARATVDRAAAGIGTAR